MRSSVIIIFMSMLLYSCLGQEKSSIPSTQELTLYARQSDRTDPGNFIFLYDKLPDDFDSINELIKCQLIHPLEAAQNSDDALALSRDGVTPDVESILEQLYLMDSMGLHYGRKYEDRLVVACYHHAILLASILRYKGFPVRMRVGYSRFFEDRMDVRFSHVVCEAWLANEQRWIMLDADRKLVDMDEDDFDLAGTAWFNLKEGSYDPEKYLASIARGLKGCIFLMELDAACLSGNEKLYWNLPVISTEDIETFEKLEPGVKDQLDKLAELIRHPDQKTDSIRMLHSQIQSFQSAGLRYNEYIDLLLKRE